MLGVLHRAAVGLIPKSLSMHLHVCADNFRQRGWTIREHLHKNQLRDPIDGSHTKLMERSILGLIYTYNCLPTRVVELRTVSAFQRVLQNAIKYAVRRDLPDWQLFFKHGVRGKTLQSFQSYFATNT